MRGFKSRGVDREIAVDCANLLCGRSYWTCGQWPSWRIPSEGLLGWAVSEPIRATAEQLTRWYLDSLPDVKRFLCRRFRLRRSDAEDVCQELYLRLIEYGEGRAVDNPRAYIHRAAVNVWQNMNERVAHRLPHESEWIDGLIAASEDEPHYILERASEIDSVSAAIQLLTDRQRWVVELHFVANFSYNEIASETGLSARTVLRELTRAYAKLRQIFEHDA